jgi:hypothetical protein
MEMYAKYFYFEFFDILKYIKNVFQTKGAYAPGSKKDLSIRDALLCKFVTLQWCLALPCRRVWITVSCNVVRFGKLN